MRKISVLMFLVLGIIGTLILIDVIRPTKTAASEVKRFSSDEELKSYVQKNTELMQKFDRLFYSVGFAPRSLGIAVGTAEEGVFSHQNAPLTAQESKKAIENAGPAADAGVDFSTTNIQVEGVDEADIVKSDGKYLYVISGPEVAIVNAYPAENAKVLSKIKVDGTPEEIFINKNRLMVFENRNYQPGMAIKVYDLTDRGKPVLKRDIVLNNGSYLNSRMIGDYVYVIANLPVEVYKPFGPDKQPQKREIQLPEITINGGSRIIPAQEIHYFDYPDYSYRYTLIISFNTQDDRQEANSKTFLTGAAQNIFASQDNIYLVGAKSPDIALYTQRLTDGLAKMLPADLSSRITELAKLSISDRVEKLEKIVNGYFSTLSDEETMTLGEKITTLTREIEKEIRQEARKTVIYKLAVANGNVEYRLKGEVPGYVLNQFSMDEHRGFFRVATTTQRFTFGEGISTRNNIYILDEKMQIAGRLEGLAPTERIYSARFMGEKAYLVTFRQLDPLFVVDLKDPHNPKVLGQLKIPGYSNYLHPYDENHLLGIGKEVAEVPREPVPLNVPEERRESEFRPGIIPPPIMRIQGVKIALFDVSDPTRPKEISKYVIDKEGADSLALTDHKAFLFSKAKNLLVLPVSYPLPVRIQDQTKIVPYSYWGWQGAYVFDVSLDKGIALKGTVSHPEDETLPLIKRAGLGYGVKRSLYIDNILYTISDRLIKISDLKDMKEIKKIEL